MRITQEMFDKALNEEYLRCRDNSGAPYPHPSLLGRLMSANSLIIYAFVFPEMDWNLVNMELIREMMRRLSNSGKFVFDD